MPRNNTNPYEPPKEYIEPRVPKYEEPIVDWPGLFIIISAIFTGLVMIFLLALL